MHVSQTVVLVPSSSKEPVSTHQEGIHSNDIITTYPSRSNYGIVVN